MKNKFLALAAVALTLGACSSDDDSSIDYSKLTQRWYIVSEKVEGETIPYENLPCGDDNVDIMQGGTLEFNVVSACNGNDAVVDTYEGTWTREGNTVLTSVFGEMTELKIKKLNSTTMVTTQVEDYDEDGDEETVETTFSTNGN